MNAADRLIVALMLEAAYHATGYIIPWDYRSARDTRTLFDLAGQLTGWEKSRRETVHTALADAIAQAEDVRSAYAVLKGRK
jgi:hypothetical protein